MNDIFYNFNKFILLGQEIDVWQLNEFANKSIHEVCRVSRISGALLRNLECYLCFMLHEDDNSDCTYGQCAIQREDVIKKSDLHLRKHGIDPEKMHEIQFFSITLLKDRMKDAGRTDSLK